METEFRSYPKIHRLGKEETDGILDGPVTVQEKVDGANVSIWQDGGTVRGGSRTRELGDDEFNGFTPYIRSNPLIGGWLQANPTKRLYGEWLVKHTITYPDDAYRQVYLYDIYDDETGTYADQATVKGTAEALGLKYPELFLVDTTTTPEAIYDFVGKSFIGANGEGVVIKHQGWVNKFGDHSYAKVVHEKFKENNAIVFGGNNKHSETYWEMYVVNKYCTMGRVQKVMQKLQPTIDRRLDIEHTSQVAGSCYHDLVTEEAWAIFKKVPKIDTKKLQGLCTRKFIQIYHDILNNSVSVADAGGNNDA
jgi:hypothetical protein